MDAPVLYLPRYYGDKHAARPMEHHVEGEGDAPLMIVSDTADLAWRMPSDEAVAIARESQADYLKSEKYLSQGDRLAAFNTRLLDHLASRRDRAAGKFSISLSR